MSNDHLFKKMCQGLYEYLLFLPIFITIGVYLLAPNTMIIWIMIVPILFIVGLIYRSVWKGKPWWHYTTFSILVSLIPTFTLIDHPWLVIVFILVHAAIIFRGMMYAGKPWEALLPVSYMWVGGFATYFIGAIIFPGNERLVEYFPVIAIGGAIIIVMTLFISNRVHIKAATLSKEEKPFVSRQVRVHNRIFIVLTLGIIAFITYGSVIQDLVLSGLRVFFQLLLRPAEDQPELTELPPPPNVPQDGMMEEATDPSLLAVIFEMIFVVVGYILLFIGIIILGLLLIRKTREWMLEGIRKLISFLKRLPNRFREDDKVLYVDEKENIFEWDDWLQDRKQQVKNFVNRRLARKPRWEKLTNEEKVRFVYRHVVQEEFNQDINLSETPRENIEKMISAALVDKGVVRTLRDAYEQVRYGEKTINDEVINEIHTLMKKR